MPERPFPPGRFIANDRLAEGAGYPAGIFNILILPSGISP